MALAHATSVLTKADRADPLERIAHAPGGPHSVSETDGSTGPRGQATARRARDRPAYVAG
jgi:hypothetical protein